MNCSEGIGGGVLNSRLASLFTQIIRLHIYSILPFCATKGSCVSVRLKHLHLLCVDRSENNSLNECFILFYYRRMC